MSQFLLIHDSDTEPAIFERILTLLSSGDSPSTVDHCSLMDDWASRLSVDLTVVAWLADDQVAQLMSSCIGSRATMALLPHPGLKQAKLGFGIAGTLDDAVSDILTTVVPVDVDLLRCNGQVVLNAVAVGETFAVTPGSAIAEPLSDRIRRLGKLFVQLKHAVLSPMRLTTAKGRTIDTVAIGALIVQHGRSLVITRNVLSDSAVNDGMLDALVLAPRSVLQTLVFLLSSIFWRGSRNGRLPPFVGQIRTESLVLSSQQTQAYILDGVPASASEIEFKVERRALRIIPGRRLSIDEHPPDSQEVVRVESLPAGEARLELAGRHLRWWHHASTEEFRELFQLVRQNARCSGDYLALMVLSTLLATFGLFANSAPVIIGAMILAPLMGPMISLAMGLLRQQVDLLAASGRSLAVGIGLALLGSALLTLLMPLQTVNSEIGARLTPTLLDLGVAVISGVAGAYAHARSEVARSLAGVAIAVALVPPLAVAGIGIGWLNLSVFSGASLLFLTNLAGILLAAAATFYCLGFSPMNRARRGLAVSMLMVGAISIPLAFSFYRMVDEHWIVNQLDGWRVEGVKIRNVQIDSLRPVILSVELVANEPLELTRIDKVKAAIERKIRRPVTIEATMAIVR